MRPNTGFSSSGLQRVGMCAAVAIIAVALALAPGSNAETPPKKSQVVRQPHPPCTIFFEATLVEQNFYETQRGNVVRTGTELKFREAPPEGYPRSSLSMGIEMTCRMSGFFDLPNLEPGERFLLYTRPSFPGSWVCGSSGLWHLADETDCDEARSGDYPMTCKPEPRGDDSGPCAMAMPGRRGRYPILCGDLRPMAVPAKRRTDAGKVRRGSTVTRARSSDAPTAARSTGPVPATSSGPVTRSRAESVPLHPTEDTRNTAQGDFNEDSRIDLAIASSDGPTVHLMLGESRGEFRPAGTISVGQRPTAIAAGDVNRDYHLDLVVARAGDDLISVFLGDGTGNFDLTSTFELTRSTCALTIGDFRGDPHPDVAVAHCGSVVVPQKTLTILTGDGAGNLEPVDPPSFRVPDSLAIADVNKDGAADIVTLDAAGNLLDVFTSD